jgi:hypothetical protein
VRTSPLFTGGKKGAAVLLEEEETNEISPSFKKGKNINIECSVGYIVEERRVQPCRKHIDKVSGRFYREPWRILIIRLYFNSL